MKENEKIRRDSRAAYRGSHILSRGHTVSTDTWETGINNNVLVFGPSGAGKTRCYVKPNILNSHESMIVSDTKGSLYGELRYTLEARGYTVKNVNFTDLKAGSGYNPLDYIRRDPETGDFSEQDILSVTKSLLPFLSPNDPFWDRASRQYMNCLVGYVLEALPEEQHTLAYVYELFNLLGTPEFEQLIEELRVLKPESQVPKRYDAMKVLFPSVRTDSCVRGFLSATLSQLCFDEALAMYAKPDKIDFTALGREKTAIFVTVSDTDRSQDLLAGTFMTQALQILCRSADHDYPDHRLPVPVRLYLDDFATNLYIPDFDKTVSVIRSREISTSVILQSITQLYALYGEAKAKTILNNCDQMLYLGGQDVDTAQLIAQKVNRTVFTVLSMPLDRAYLFVRGRAPELTEKYDPSREEKSLLWEGDIPFS